MGGEKIIVPLLDSLTPGSPPRGRGKARTLSFCFLRIRITPAWAGKSISQTSTMKPAKDHPRVGGEKHSASSSLYSPRGSPPRGRGKDAGIPILAPVMGITPAWAGKSTFWRKHQRQNRDHPRVGGEKPIRAYVKIWNEGSPPRGRGKDLCGAVGQVQGGITPAWAGKREPYNRRSAAPWDHPRVGGEKLTTDSLELASLGSPPRGRGKVPSAPFRVSWARITPAWAGKRYPRRRTAWNQRDHPRVGGEKPSKSLLRQAARGSPPRGRGKALQT